MYKKKSFVILVYFSHTKCKPKKSIILILQNQSPTTHKHNIYSGKTKKKPSKNHYSEYSDTIKHSKNINEFIQYFFFLAVFKLFVFLCLCSWWVLVFWLKLKKKITMAILYNHPVIEWMSNFFFLLWNNFTQFF